MQPDKIRGNVFVANLPHGLTDEQLAELFDPYGIVLRAHLARDPASGATLGHGLVQIAPDRVVEAAVAGVNATGIAGRKVDARRADPDMTITPPTRPRGPGGRSRPPVPDMAAQDRRTPQRPVVEIRTARTGRAPLHTTEWTRARNPHAPSR